MDDRGERGAEIEGGRGKGMEINFITFTIIFHLLPGLISKWLELQNSGWSHWKDFLSSFHTLYSFCILKQN